MLKYFLLFSVFLISQSLDAKSFRVFQIPNGSVNSCLNCHKSMLGGLPLSKFGEQVLNFGLNGENVDWKAIYNLDADEDGFTNGQELLDPDGTWTPGMADPGNPADVKKPYDANSKPLSVWSNYIQNPNISPNPSSSNFHISFQVIKPTYIMARIVDIKGNFISNLVNNYYAYGNCNITWNGITNIGVPAPKGVYFLQIVVGNTLKTEKLILM